MMVPYLEQPTLTVGPITLAPFGPIVAVAFTLGLTLGARRFRELGLDSAFGERFGWWVVVGGFIGAHLFSVLFYFPEKVMENPLVLLKLWEDISSFGGIVGAVIAMVLLLRRAGGTFDASTRWAYVDGAAYAFPFSLMVGRLACSIAHDHPGTVTSSPLAVSLASVDGRSFIARMYEGAGRVDELPPTEVLAGMGFHDLGWYEFLYLAAVVVPITLLLARRERHQGPNGRHRPGTFFVAFVVLYMPIRFGLDFLRISDVRYAGLTPAQWAALVALGALPFVVRQMRRLPVREYAQRAEDDRPHGADRHGIPGGSVE